MAGLLLAGCRPPATSAERREEVRFRPDPTAASAEAAWLLDRVPGATWDRGLAHAVRLLTAAATDRGARLTPAAMADARSAAGYPGNARFARELTGGAWPERLARELEIAALSRPQPVDVALARRTYGDDTTLWIGAIAHRPALLDPIPRDLDLDEMVPVAIEVLDPGGGDVLGRVPQPVLFVAPPAGPVIAHELSTERALWVDDFHLPGTYRLEVVARSDRDTQVVLWWTHHVEGSPAPPVTLPRAVDGPRDPIGATDALYGAVNDLRREAGLRPLERFLPFESLAREHAAWMAAHATVAHRIEGVTGGVAARAAASWHPRARHREDLAAAATWQDALDMVSLSPGHLRNLLCESCSHLSVGVALEPVIARPPRLFVVLEVLEFPEGVPRRSRVEGRVTPDG